jgi:hypothetical protein
MQLYAIAFHLAPVTKFCRSRLPERFDRVKSLDADPPLPIVAARIENLVPMHPFHSISGTYWVLTGD